MSEHRNGGNHVDFFFSLRMKLKCMKCGNQELRWLLPLILQSRSIVVFALWWRMANERRKKNGGPTNQGEPTSQPIKRNTNDDKNLLKNWAYNTVFLILKYYSHELL